MEFIKDTRNFHQERQVLAAKLTNQIPNQSDDDISNQPDSVRKLRRMPLYTSKNMIYLISQKTVKSFIKSLKSPIRNKSFNSHEWLRRREVDPYVEISRQKNYRCRSAFKLIEIDDRYKLLKPGLKVLDIGAAPGSWSQVLADRTNSNGKDKNNAVGLVIAVDLLHFQDIEGVVVIPKTDFSKESSQSKILEILGEEKRFDFIFSDMAPAATGVKSFDQDRIFNLVYAVLVFAIKNLKIGGGCLVKVWEGGQVKDLRSEMKRFFHVISNVKPNASYANSSELFLLARDFKGLKT